MSDPAGDDRSRLLFALALSQRFHLYLVQVESPRAADQLLAGLVGDLAALGREGARVVRLDPYAGRETADPLTKEELDERVLVPLLDTPEEVWGAIQVVDVSRAPPEDGEAWGRVLALWNEKRGLVRGDHGEVVVLLPEAMEKELSRWAPDVWSIRSGEYVVREREARVGEGGPLLDVKLLICAAPAAWLFEGVEALAPWLDDLDPRGPPRRLHGDRAIGEGRFVEAEAFYREILEHSDPLTEETAMARAGLCIALTAQGRAPEAVEYGEQAMSIVGRLKDTSPPVRARVYGSVALLHWCLGHLSEAQRLDNKLPNLLSYGPASRRARFLRLVDRGRTTEAEAKTTLWARRAKMWESLLVAEFGLLLAKPVCPKLSILGEHVVHNARTRRAAVIEIARGNTARARFLLQRVPWPSSEPFPEDDALSGYAIGLLNATEGRYGAAVASFQDARSTLAQDWGFYGLAIRERKRALAMVDLCLTQLEPDPARALLLARDLAAATIALLGDTGEDCIARAIAVLAHAELTRRLAASSPSEAPEAAGKAVALAEPLRALDVPAWNAVIRHAERQREEIRPGG